MPEAIPPVGASWDQEAPKPARCCFKGKTGAFYGQEKGWG